VRPKNQFSLTRAESSKGRAPQKQILISYDSPHVGSSRKTVNAFSNRLYEPRSVKKQFPMNSTMRFVVSLALGLGIICAGICQSQAQPQFYSNSLPSVVYPGEIVFDVMASSTANVLHELLSAPTNASLRLVGYHPPYARITWNTPSTADPGTTNVFLIQARDSLTLLSATNIIRMVVIPLPPIRLVQVSNSVPVLLCDSLLSDKGYFVEWTAVLPATNWTPLSAFWHPPPSVILVDTNPPASQKFYRMRSFAQFYCLVDCP
jgi:hypothetical protein